MRVNTPRHKYVAARPRTYNPGTIPGSQRLVYHKPVRRHTIGDLLRMSVYLLFAAITLGLLVLLVLNLFVKMQTQDVIYNSTDASLPHHHVAIVFGAGLNKAGEPSKMLYDRIATAADLYTSGKADKLLMTGDNSSLNYNEVEVMRKTAVGLGVPDGDIVLDYAGFSTWDSCYRARDVFSLSEATLVTQRFHLPRALYTCKQLGVDSTGVAADRQTYPTTYNELREFPAVASTFWSLMWDHQPRFLGPKVDVDEQQIR